MQLKIDVENLYRNAFKLGLNEKSMEKKKLAFISEDRYFNKIFKEILNYEGFDVSQFDNFTEARKELSEKKFDIIYLEPFALPAGYGEDISNKEINKSIVQKEHFGRKLLTDIIREKNSINYKTPVNVCLDTEFLHEPQYYLNKGANKVFIKCRETYDSISDIMKEQATFI
jgi:hypothetical protein